MTPTELAFLTLLTALQLADLTTTRRILALGGYERNPVVRWLMSRLGEDLGLVVAKAGVMIIGLLAVAFLGPAAVWVLAGLCGVFGFVVWGNFKVIGRLK